MHCQASVRFWSPHKSIRMGNHIGIGHNCIFLCDVEMGNKVLIACHVGLVNRDDHRYDCVGKTMWDSGRGDRYKIVVEDDVWIGHGAILMAPLRVGRGAIIAAGSVVVGDVARYSIVGGAPARILKMRFSHAQIAEHEAMLIKQGELKPEEQTV